MALIETESLVLRSYDLADADRIVVLLTREHGVVRAVAKGSKRLKSRFGSGLEPFSEVEVTYFQKDSQELVSLQKVEIISSNFDAASQPEFLHKFAYLADLLLAFSLPHDPNEALYRMARACVGAAVRQPDSLQALAVYFESWVLRLSGYMADWAKCDSCGRTLDETETTNLQANLHLMCAVCRKGSWSRPVEARVREIAKRSRSVAPPEFAAMFANYVQDIDAYSRILKLMASHAIGREITGEKAFQVPA